MQTLATAKRNFAIWKSKIEKAFKDELKGEIDEDDVELVVEMFVEMVTSSSKFNGDTIREALDVVSSDDDFDRNSISKEILERIQLSDAHAFPPQTTLPAGTTCRARLKEDEDIEVSDEDNEEE